MTDLLRLVLRFVLRSVRRRIAVFEPLLVPRTHSYALSRLRATFLIRRARQMCLIFAVLTISWSAIDAALLPSVLWVPIAIARLVAGVGFAMLAMNRISNVSLGTSYALIGGLFGITLSFLFFALSLIAVHGGHGESLALSTAYMFAPYILAACVGFFPLTLVESLMMLILPMLIYMWGCLSKFAYINPAASPYEMIWILAMTLATSTMIAMSQASYIISLFGNTAYDTLTTLYVRSIGEEILDQQFALATRYGHPFSLVLFDIDYFKLINDRFGHHTGDAVLAHIGQLLHKLLRQQDIAIRWGGEEFLLLLPDTTKAQAEGLIRRIASHTLYVLPDQRRVTASIGVAEYASGETTHWRDIVNAADRRLYIAKNAGRNRYVIDEVSLTLDGTIIVA